MDGARRGYDAAVAIIRRLREAGATAYLAGGCVRDALLGQTPKDYDVATSALPDQVKGLFRGSRFVGEAFGVVLVRMQRQQVEVATFREEWGYTDRRRPDQVAFSDARHDALRRDFTINGMFADPIGRGEAEGDAAARQDLPGFGTVLDFVGGLADIAAKQIRAVGDADERFGEDYLRMLRAVRFAGRLGFDLEPRTAAAIRPNAKYLGQISRERIGLEVMTMLEAPSRARSAALLQSLRLDGPTLTEDTADPDVPTLTALEADTAAPTALAAWMIDRHASERSLAGAAAFAHRQGERVLQRWRRALCLSNEDRDALRAVLLALATLHEWDRLPMAGRKRLLARPGLPSAMELLRAIEPSRAAAIEQDARPLHEEGVAPAPLIDGNDLIGLGLKPGPQFKRLLDSAYDAQLEHRVTTRDEALNWLRDASNAGRR